MELLAKLAKETHSQLSFLQHINKHTTEKIDEEMTNQEKDILELADKRKISS